VVNEQGLIGLFMPHTLVVFSCDQNYFLLAKGLVLSLLQCELDCEHIGLAFLDAGCDRTALDWLKARGVEVRALDASALGALEPLAQGYLRSLVFRPLLPKLFPGVEAFVWLDSDTWVQQPQSVAYLADLARSGGDRIFICPEWHYGYSDLNDTFVENQLKNLAFYHRTIYGEEMVREMYGRPVLNCGVFAMAAKCPLWDMWWNELVELYQRDYGAESERVRHMAEQIALNVLARRNQCAVLVDPLFNYLCMWGMPFRDEQGMVRVALPPGNAIGVVHLSLWKVWRKAYFEKGLLYQRGEYLSAEEQETLLK
jgi:hypothetical protein